MCNLECDWAAIMFNLLYCVLYVLFQLSAHCVIKIRHGLQEKDFFCFWLELKNALMSWRLCVCWKSMWASVKTQKHNSLCKFVRYFRWSLHKGIRCRDVIKISSFPCTLSVLSPLDRRQSTKALKTTFVPNPSSRTQIPGVGSGQKPSNTVYHMVRSSRRAMDFFSKHKITFFSLLLTSRKYIKSGLYEYFFQKKNIYEHM